MRGAQYNFEPSYGSRKRKSNWGKWVLYGLRTLGFGSAVFFIVLYWPDNWADILIAFLEWLRYV